VLEVSNHTEVNFRVIVDWYINFLLCLSRPTIILWWMIVRNDLHSLLDEFMALIFETLAVAELAGVNTSTEVVVLRGWRRGSV